MNLTRVINADHGKLYLVKTKDAVFTSYAHLDIETGTLGFLSPIRKIVATESECLELWLIEEANSKHPCFTDGRGFQ